MPPDTRSGQTVSEALTSFLKSEEFGNIITTAVNIQTKKLLKEIQSLKDEVIILPESNIQLVNLLMNNSPAWNKVVQGKNMNTDNISNKSKIGMNDKIIDNNSARSGTVEKRSNKKEATKPRIVDCQVYTQVETENRNKDGEWEYQRKQRKLNEHRENLMYENQRSVNNRYRPRVSIVQGTAKSGIAIGGAERYSYFHVCYLDPKLNDRDLMSYLKDCNITQVKCEKLNSKFPDEYSSFKIGVPYSQVETIKNPEIWPEGVSINRFFQKRQQLPITT